MRYLEIDLLRSLAIVLMVVYHTAFDLWYFYGWNIDVFSGGWWILARSTAVLFLLLVGVSFVLSSRTCMDSLSIWKKCINRGMVVLAFAMLVTVVTWVLDPSVYIRFGVLHCIGVSLFILPLFEKFGIWNIVIGAGIVLLGLITKQQSVSTLLFMPLGLVPADFSTLDYFPLLPWLGVIVIGIGIGQILCQLHFWEGRAGLSPFVLQVLSRHSLAIYLLHQPILLTILWVFLG